MDFAEAHVRDPLGDTFELEIEERISVHREVSGQAYWDYRMSGFGPMTTLTESLDTERLEEVSRAWVDFTETMRNGDGSRTGVSTC